MCFFFHFDDSHVDSYFFLTVKSFFLCPLLRGSNDVIGYSSDTKIEGSLLGNFVTECLFKVETFFRSIWCHMIRNRARMWYINQ